VIAELQRNGASREGFTLLEVMVAIAILALSLTAIFSSEAGAIKMAHRSRKMGMATLLARCKMGEIEEQVAKEGLPALFDSGSDECCEEGEIDGFECEWEIAPVVMPETMFPTGEEEGEEGAGGDPMSKIGAAMGIDPSNPQAAAGMDPTQLLAGGGMGGLASMALSFVYPVLKPSFEAQIRRATVTVHWKEGEVGHEFDVTQYMVADQPLAMPDPSDTTGQGTLAPAAPGVPGI
jgi:general secretion pathway protein I